MPIDSRGASDGGEFRWFLQAHPVVGKKCWLLLNQ
jgi:hypothetical protein